MKHIFTLTDLPKKMKEIFTLTDIGLQIGRSEKVLLILSRFSSWEPPRPKTRPLGAAKSVEMNCLLLRISCCSVGQVPAHQPAPAMGRPN
jgi:hypothetical protein